MLMFGVDVGGTFTDVILFDEETGAIIGAKVPSTPANQAEGFGKGLEAVGVDFNRVSRGLHGTTVATNAAIERKGAGASAFSPRASGMSSPSARANDSPAACLTPAFKRPRP